MFDLPNIPNVHHEHSMHDQTENDVEQEEDEHEDEEKPLRKIASDITTAIRLAIDDDGYHDKQSLADTIKALDEGCIVVEPA